MTPAEIRELVLSEIRRQPDQEARDVIWNVWRVNTNVNPADLVAEWGNMMEAKRVRQIWVNTGSLSRPRWIKRWITT